MSEPRVTPEASMEEILASIRRIISEDGSPPALQAAAPEFVAPQAAEQAAPAPVPDAPPPTPPDDSPPAPSSPPAPPVDLMTPTPVRSITGNQPASTGAALVLTQMVAEDGSVVAVGRPAAPDPAVSRQSQPLDVLLLTDALPTNLPDVAVAVAQPPAPVAPQVPASPVVPPLKPKSQTGRASPETLIQSNAVLSQLNRNRVRDGGPTLEELVRQSLEPKIQEWLNANLEDIVERLVQEEIQRISRRAE